MEEQNPPRFAPLTESQRDWIESLLRDAETIANAFAPDSRGQLTLERLDAAHSAWQSQGIEDQNEITATINAVGTAFGEAFVQALGFEWGVVHDQFGTDLAIRSRPDAGEIFIFPVSFVAKRWKRGETDFLAASFHAIQDQVRSILSKKADDRR